MEGLSFSGACLQVAGGGVPGKVIAISSIAGISRPVSKWEVAAQKKVHKTLYIKTGVAAGRLAHLLWAIGDLPANIKITGIANFRAYMPGSQPISAGGKTGNGLQSPKKKQVATATIMGAGIQTPLQVMFCW